jgi:hypothetical protein
LRLAERAHTAGESGERALDHGRGLLARRSTLRVYQVSQPVYRGLPGFCGQPRRLEDAFEHLDFLEIAGVFLR